MGPLVAVVVGAGVKLARLVSTTRQNTAPGCASLLSRKLLTSVENTNTKNLYTNTSQTYCVSLF